MPGKGGRGKGFFPMTTDGAGHDSLIGQALGHYRITEKIGSGGMGVVYRARDEHLDRRVAIKVLRPGTLADESSRRHFRFEALALSKLNHPNIATIYDFDTQQDLDFLAMEYIPGTTLSDQLLAGPLPEKEITRIGAQLAKGLAAAHEQGVIHRDLKPGNLRLTPDGWLKILDFGLAKLVHPKSVGVTTETLTETQSVAGTLPYMAPEQLLGEKVDARTDIYAMGAVLYEMATGQRPFPHGHGPSLIDAILHESPTPPSKLSPGISAALDAVVTKALQKDPLCRYASAEELLQDLEQQRAPQVAGALRPSAGATTQVWRRLSRRQKTAAFLSVMMACTLAFVLWSHSGTTALAFAPRDYVLISDFENQTGNPVFDLSLNTALATSLEQSSHANVYPRARLKETLGRMEKPSIEHIDEALALEIAEREGIKAVVVPSIVGVGERYRLAVRLRAVSSGRDFKTEVSRAKGKEKVLDAVDELARDIRRDLGESLQKISETSKPLAEVTTQSLEALKQYSLAIEKHRAGEAQEAKTFYENALSIDPTFTAARASLGMLHLDQAALGTPQFDAELGKRLLSEAVQHVANLTDKERYGILAFHAQWVEHDPEKAVRYFKTLLAIYPEYPVTFSNLAWVYRSMGRYDDSIAAAKEAIRLDPRLLIAYLNLAGIQLYQLGDVKSGLETCQQALQVDARNAAAHDCVGWAFMGKGDWAQAQAAFEKAVAFNPQDTLSRFRLAHAHRLQGHYQQAVQALEPILKIDPSDASTLYDLGVAYELMGEHEKAHEHFLHFREQMEAEWKKNPKNADIAFSLAAVHARLGADQRCWSFAHKGLALDPSRHFEYATILSLEQRKREAVEQLQEGIQNGYRNYIWIKIHPDLQPLYGEPRFEKLLAEAIKS